MRKVILIFSLILSINISAQDSTRSEAFKNKWPHNRVYPLIKPTYPSYPLMTAYILQKNAREDDPFAQHELALRYLTGQGLPKDTVKAVYWIQKAIEKNLTSARFNYGIMLNNGIGVDWNPFEAYNHFKFAAENGMPEGQFIYGIFLTDNLVVNRNYTQAYIWVKKSSDQKFEPAKEVIKEFEKMGIQAPVDSTSSIVQINQPSISQPLNGSDQNSIWGEDWELDFFEFDADTATTDETKAYLESILSKSNNELKSMLGISKISDSVSTKDTTGLGLIEFAVSKGSPEALLIAARGYEEGVGVEKDLVKAAVRYLRSYRLGSNKAAQYLIKLIQNDGFYDLLKERVDEGDPDAMYTWAGLVALGFDYQLTDEQALELLEKGVDRDHVYSIIEKGLCYYSGTLVEQDKEKAIEYWQQAVDLGSEEAKVRIAFSNINEGKGDPSKEINTLMISSEEGSVIAQAALAYCYENGMGIKQNKAEAAGLYRKAAHRGNQAAYSSLLKMYDGIRPGEEEFVIHEE